MASDQLLDLIDGMTQDERRIQALDPGYIKIDDRKITDLLKFMADMAGQVNYYNEKNRIDGTWEDFFKADLNVLIVLITRFDLTSHLTQFEKLETKIQTATDDRETLLAFKDLFLFIGDIINLLISTRSRLESGTNYNKAAGELAAIIDGFTREVKRLNGHRKQAEKTFGKDFENSGNEKEIRQKILSALPSVKKDFAALRSKYNNFLGVASFYFKDHDLARQEFHPHLALCITFLHLYQFLQDLVNRLPAQHLDFYYREVLGIEPKNAAPDSVHIVFDPSALSPVDLAQGEELQAEPDGKRVYYSLNEDITVTPAKVVGLKTLFLDEHIQVVSPNRENEDVTEVEVYKASYDNIQPAAFLKQTSVDMWPILGESQFELADNDRTMEDTEIGLLLASPVLYQTEGQRAVFLSIYFEAGSFRQLVSYFRNFARVTNKLIDTVSYELLSDAFVISFTTEKGWQEVKHYSVRINMAENNIEVRFELSPVDSAFDIYSPEIHGEDYQVEWPVVRLLLNTYSIHNPFSFFRKLIIDRVTIRADVKGSRALKLQNNIGNLSADNPFQPFGPQPSVGSYIDIKNTNIFNRFTKDFCIRLEWIDLPRDIGGWDSYYKEYDANITTDSFRVRLSGLSQGKFKPPVPLQQEFRLFEREKGEFGVETLNDVSEIKDVDIKQLEFPNRPLLNNEALVPDVNFTEGAVRLELSAPQDAFGSRIYPQIFPEAVIHNSRRFAKKRRLPNPPYIPVVKSITVDYTLEHSEVLLKTVKNEDSALKIVHQYPFGYEAVYPESDRQPYHFIPDFEYENNLYIGIQDLHPEQDLTLLFQLEEKNFSNTAREPEPIFWSYMYDNSWIRLEKGEVLYDTTNNFINTGIVKIRMPEDINTGNTKLPPDLYWLRASSRGQTNVMSKMIGVYPHAVIATRVMDDEQGTGEFRLPANSIKSFRNKVPGIGSIFQLFPSYGGHPAETIEQYYIRVSERLRHKRRLITNRDIEEVILDEFPGILMAKCISPEMDFRNGYTRGNNKLRIILVPKERGQGYFSDDQPKVNLATLYQIKTFLKTLISPFTEIEVENPVYEKIKIVAKIKFRHKKSSDDGLYLKRLNDDIRGYLCPWLYESSSSFKIGTQIYLTEVLNFIKKRPYIDYITGFSILHFYNWVNAETGEVLSGVNDFGRHSNVNSIRGSVPEAVIIPSAEHLFTIIEKTEYSEPEDVGIGNLLIADELLVYDDNLSPGAQNLINEDKSFTDDNEYFNLLISHNIK